MGLRPLASLQSFLCYELIVLSAQSIQHTLARRSDATQTLHHFDDNLTFWYVAMCSFKFCYMPRML